MNDQPQATEADANEALTQANEKLIAWLSPPTAVFLQGCIGCLSNVNAAYVLLGICETMARLIGHMYAGKPEAVKDFRVHCMNVFSNALNGAEIRELPQQPANAPDANAAA